MMPRTAFRIAILVPLLSAPAVGVTADGIALVGRELLVQTPRYGVRIGAVAFYSRATQTSLLARFSEQTQSDKDDVAYRMFSVDNGVTWSPPQRIETHRQVPGGTLRRSERVAVVDPTRDVLVMLILQGTFPRDNPLEGMKRWTLRYALSRDGGHTWCHEAPIVHRGKEYSTEHPLPGVWVGKSAAMIGDTTCVPLRIATGEILVPIQISPVGPKGEYWNPGGGFTYHDSAVLIARWTPDERLEWEMSSLVKADPARTTRGLLEPTLAELPNGQVLMVMRASNDAKPNLPSYRWCAVSKDHGHTWSAPKPWTYSNGRPFFSPSSCSQLLRHSNGRTYWIGNLSPQNPHGNAPRYPLVIGQVDDRSLLLIEDTMCIIDTRQPSDPPGLTLSNFHAREDRVTREILVHLTPFGRGDRPKSVAGVRQLKGGLDWTSSAYIYRLRVPRGR